MSTDPSDFHCHSDMQVRFGDLDAMGHVNNAVYFTYFEVARTSYMRQLGFESPGEGRPMSDLFPYILAEASCRFLAPISLGQAIVLHARTTRMGTKSFDLEFLVTDGSTGAALAVGRTVQVFYDYEAHSSVAVPAAVRARIEALEGRRLEA